MTASDPLFGAFITPVSSSPQQPVELAIAAEKAGLDLVTFQDHPYQPALLDAWTLLTYVAAKTERIRLAGNVLNLPLRPPATLARAAATLDLLSGGRFEMALGAGAFTEAIVAMGGPERTPGQGRRALDEAITIMREIWDTDTRGGVRVDGEFYTVSGAKRGPAPAHPIEIWVGGYGPRMVEFIGRRADGWMPSLSYLKEGVAALPALNERIDQSARATGRDPGDIRRFLNIHGKFAPTRTGLLAGPPEAWAQDLATLARDYRVTGFILATDDPEVLARYGEQVIPATRELLKD